MCPTCGTYRGKEVIDVVAGAVKKDKKMKEKMATRDGGATEKKETALDAKKLSNA